MGALPRAQSRAPGLGERGPRRAEVQTLPGGAEGAWGGLRRGGGGLGGGWGGGLVLWMRRKHWLLMVFPAGSGFLVESKPICEGILKGKQRTELC